MYLQSMSPLLNQIWSLATCLERIIFRMSSKFEILHKDGILIAKSESSMMFNLPANEQFSRTGEDPTSGILTKLFIGLQNTAGPATWQKRFLWHIASAGDRQDFNQSARKIASWNFDRIIPCHGDVIESGGKDIFKKVFDWHLNPPSK